MDTIKNLNIQNLLQHILVADSYTMPLHWNYDLKNIDTLIENGSIDLSMLNSGKYNTYFASKEKGQQSHYGDMLLHLYHYGKNNSSFSTDEYSKSWQQFVENYDGHKDGSTKSTLQNLQKNITPYYTTSTDFCGVLCGVSLIVQSHADNSAEDIITSIQKRSDMTHNHALIRAGIQWLIHASIAVSNEYSIEQTIQYANSKTNDTELIDLIKKGQALASTDKSTRLLIEDAGLGCDIRSNLPYCILLLLREKFDFMKLMQSNIIAGSDSAPRAMFLAYLLGSRPHHKLPKDLLSQLKVSI